MAEIEPDLANFREERRVSRNFPNGGSHFE